VFGEQPSIEAIAANLINPGDSSFFDEQMGGPFFGIPDSVDVAARVVVLKGVTINVAPDAAASVVVCRSATECEDQDSIAYDGLVSADSILQWVADRSVYVFAPHEGTSLGVYAIANR
jgi:hypothetical protein